MVLFFVFEKAYLQLAFVQTERLREDKGGGGNPAG